MALSNVRWEGLKELEVMSTILPGRIITWKLREAYKYALEPTRNAMRNNVARRSGRLYYSIDTTIMGGAQANTLTMYGIVGPRRKRGVWNMQGWAAHLVEEGTKPHDINAGARNSMPLYKAKRFLGFVKRIKHSGTKNNSNLHPFRRAIDATWQDVGARISSRVGESMAKEIEAIKREYGSTHGQL